MLVDAVEDVFNASEPNAVLSAPVVLAHKDSKPTAVLLDAVVFKCKAHLPIAVFAIREWQTILQHKADVMLH